jgi:N6-adenosine-specific RNA methylase IME4
MVGARGSARKFAEALFPIQTLEKTFVATAFLWATVPMFPDALEVMKAWGFEYKSCVTWAKNRIGTGCWFRNQMSRIDLPLNLLENYVRQ